MDKNGVALGHISIVGGSGERTPYGLEMVKLGLARVDDRGTTALPIAFANELQAAQAAAQAAKRGIWCVRACLPHWVACACVCLFWGVGKLDVYTR